jgi:hypothetical protein
MRPRLKTRDAENHFQNPRKDQSLQDLFEVSCGSLRSEILRSDPSLRYIADLPPGWSAERKDLNSEWHRYPDAAE